MPTPAAPPREAVARFRREYLARFGELLEHRPLLIAVSGGTDSVALLVLAAAAFPGRVRAATVDHGIRSESAREAQAVARLCAALGVGHAILRGDMAARIAGTANLSARARHLRYRLLEEERRRLDAQAILTAHQADDQVETLVMRLNRSSGVGGLAGVRARNDWLHRPLLEWTRAELGAVLAHCRITPLEDPSNRDDRFDRARLRKLLAGNQLFDAVAVSRSMALLAEADAALDRLAQAQFDELYADENEIEFDLRNCDVEIIHRVSRLCIARLDPQARPRGEALARLRALEPDQKISIGNVTVEFERVPLMPGDTSEDAAYWPVFRFRRAPPRRMVPADQ